MLSSLLAHGVRAVAITTVAGAMLLGLPTTVAAAAPAHTSSAAVDALLYEGVGMGASPSVRVRRMQTILQRRGFSVGPPGIDGRFGPYTAGAVRRLQRRYGLTRDGIVGPETRRVMNRIADARSMPHIDRTGRTSAPRSRDGRRRRAGSAPAAAQTQPSMPAQTQPSMPAQTSSGPMPAQAQSTAPRGQTADAATPSAPSAAGRSRGVTFATVLGGVAVALSLAALAVALSRGRRAPASPLARMEHPVLLKGHSSDPDIGDFRGFALVASARPGAEYDYRQTRFLVDDLSKPAPVWVLGRDVERSPSDLPAGAPVIGYVTVGAPEERSHRELSELCAEAGWKLEEVVREEAANGLLQRPGLTYALRRIAAGHARALVAIDDGGMTRSVSDLAALLRWFEDANAALIVPSMDLDTTTMLGKQTMATLVAASGGHQRGGSSAALPAIEPSERGGGDPPV